ncbi:hypothetical protein GCM10009799_04920 [Nocardiopsis rhodophaea]|uniref:Uncharacterized protein n=1 Tax=Nocardiopsis rhodophaea TaxID=280238 RepID=A0ABN2S9I2_9ACTN
MTTATASNGATVVATAPAHPVPAPMISWHPIMPAPFFLREVRAVPSDRDPIAHMSDRPPLFT